MACANQLRNMPLDRSASAPTPGTPAPTGKLPDFFIIGAPKCGTTALAEYLSNHPDVFMARKEMHHFGADLHFGSQIFRRKEAAYLAEFTGWNGQLLAGEASVWYLYSKQAAAEIKAFNPKARIIIMVREPAEMLYALYYQFRLDGNEHLPTFGQALAAEADRRAGRGLSRSTYFGQGLYYREVARYTEQIRRYIELFGREQVHVVVYDDFAADTVRAYGKVLEFLGLQARQPVSSFQVINPAQAVRSPFLRSIMSDPLVRGTAVAMHAWLPRRAFAWLQQMEGRLMRFNFRPAKRPQLDDAVRRSIELEFAPEVERLSQLLGRDLTYWSRGEHRIGSSAGLDLAAKFQPGPVMGQISGQAGNGFGGREPTSLRTCSKP